MIKALMIGWFLWLSGTYLFLKLFMAKGVKKIFEDLEFINKLKKQTRK